VLCRVDGFLGHLCKLPGRSCSQHEPKTASSLAAGDRSFTSVILFPLLVWCRPVVLCLFAEHGLPYCCSPLPLQRLPAPCHQLLMTGTTLSTLFSAATGAPWSLQSCRTLVSINYVSLFAVHVHVQWADPTSTACTWCWNRAHSYFDCQLSEGTVLIQLPFTILTVTYVASLIQCVMAKHVE